MDAAAGADALVYVLLELLPAAAMVLALGVRGGGSSGSSSGGSSGGGSGSSSSVPGPGERRRTASGMDGLRELEKLRGSSAMDRSFEGSSSSSSSSIGSAAGGGRGGLDRSRDGTATARSTLRGGGGGFAAYGAAPLTHLAGGGRGGGFGVGGLAVGSAVGSAVGLHERKRTDSDFAAPSPLHAFESSGGSGAHYPRPSGGSGPFAFGRAAHTPLPPVQASPTVATTTPRKPPPPLPTATANAPPLPGGFGAGGFGAGGRGGTGTWSDGARGNPAGTWAPRPGSGGDLELRTPHTVPPAPPAAVRLPQPPALTDAPSGGADSGTPALIAAPPLLPFPSLAAPQPLHPTPRRSGDGPAGHEAAAAFFQPQHAAGQAGGV
jgi:hypothetical protein